MNMHVQAQTHMNVFACIYAHVLEEEAEKKELRLC